MDRTFFTAFDKITRRSWSFDMLINNIFQTNTAKNCAYARLHCLAYF